MKESLTITRKLLEDINQQASQQAFEEFPQMRRDDFIQMKNELFDTILDVVDEELVARLVLAEVARKSIEFIQLNK